MSRIGNKLIYIPTDVKVQFNNYLLTITGKYGTLSQKIEGFINVIILNNTIQLKLLKVTNETKSYHGLTRALIQNMIVGVNILFTKILVLDGIGFKFQLTDQFLIVHAGYSHPIKIKKPSDLALKLKTANKIEITGINKVSVGLFAAEIRKIRPPEPYKGKGIRYVNEIIKRKAGKSGR
jgi:large subunit ribosomal protein L6